MLQRLFLLQGRYFRPWHEYKYRGYRGVIYMAMHYLDMLGESCPHPLYGAQEKIEKMQKDDVLVIETDRHVD